MSPAGIFDFSTAPSWVVGGFIAGVLFYALLRILSGVDSRRKAALSAAEVRLAEAEAMAAAASAERSRIEGDLASAAARATLGSRLEYEVEQLRNTDRQRLAAMKEAEKQLAAAREELETQRDAAVYYEDELSRLAAKHEQAVKSAYSQMSEVKEIGFTASNGHLSASSNDAAGQLAAAREELETQRNIAQYYQDEFTRLAAKHDESVKSAYAQLSEMNELTQALNDRIADEAVIHDRQIAALEEQIDAALRDGGGHSDPNRSEVAALVGAVNQLRTEVSELRGVVGQSRL